MAGQIYVKLTVS